jgi:hypothetical protein
MGSGLDYAPFGAPWLRGVTPARLAVVALVCLSLTLVEAHVGIARLGLTQRVVLGVAREWARVFTSAIPLMLFVVWADRRTLASPWKVRLAGFALATFAGAAAFAAIKTGLQVLLFRVNWLAWPTYPLIPVHFYRAALAGGLLCAVLFFVGREREAARRLLEARLARVATERQIAEARLQLLRAQIEPHFLFNSLASVKLLYEQETGGGRHLLRNLNAYLRAAVGRAREEETALADQVAMARSFLEIFAQRMGDRLRVSVDVPAELQRARVPSLMLGTLVENAVKHGIGPRDTGGSIAISARADSGQLVLEVADDGRGFHGEAGTGVGLANTRARLASLYGAEGDLDLRTNPAGGITAGIRMPLRLAQGEPASPHADSLGNETTPARPDSAARRLRNGLTWKHWAWAVAIGVSFAALERLRTFAAVGDNLGWVWLEETGIAVAAACLFMMAIVVVETLRDGSNVPAGWAYFSGWLAAAVLSGFIAWTFTGVAELPPRAVAGAPVKAIFDAAKAPGINVGVGNLLFIGLPIIVYGAIGTLLYVWLRNSQRAAEALARAEIERSEAERRLIASRIEAVEAEVDPSFIFGTLESIERTYDHDRAAADAMLDELIAFLRAAIPRLRPDQAEVPRAAARASA